MDNSTPSPDPIHSTQNEARHPYQGENNAPRPSNAPVSEDTKFAFMSMVWSHASFVVSGAVALVGAVTFFVAQAYHISDLEKRVSALEATDTQHSQSNLKEKSDIATEYSPNIQSLQNDLNDVRTSLPQASTGCFEMIKGITKTFSILAGDEVCFGAVKARVGFIDLQGQSVTLTDAEQARKVICKVKRPCSIGMLIRFQVMGLVTTADGFETDVTFRWVP
ncbi:hypothetical protein P9A16_34370 [Shinella sp. 838]|uniref:hypothetical protein n=1 Tax=Shinella sp. 838 TaxID=3038164 RepID=UPI002415235E|nr:hypothetical protein [Shinella sp. 838]MDG4676171.1 hypothetical protein [Shinella sp. 838]